ncbi:uncharacterized protein E0L32_009207 [Thyridium curvatum]|uniref:MI domain-containing protein n=1 Tax=Thyridium curvatum TaxID=1093900 RepID=A0A507ASD2_9PEZI|nr:uncharacterized protein E0L32_009207 [Thyridium curvatum]TPX09606.1 hypothetical protein E0L32_009207 [Thyridium curvatum]
MSTSREGPSLSAGFLKHLGLEAPAENKGKGRARRPSRKERRKEERSGKKGHQPAAPRQASRDLHRYRRQADHTTRKGGKAPVQSRQEPGNPRAEKPRTAPQSVSKDLHEDFEGFGSSETDSDLEETAEASAPKISKAVRERLAADDEEIAELERKLGLKKRKTLPKSFREDGLDELLGGTEEADEASHEKKKRKAEADEWLAQKRRKASAQRKGLYEEDEDVDDAVMDELDHLEADSDDDAEWSEDIDLGSDQGLDDADILGEDLDDDRTDGDDDPGSSGLESDAEDVQQQPRKRENPYVAPTTATTAKYVPPSRRQEPASDQELVSRIRKQVQGLVNRLTESNMVAILNDVEKLYRSNPRQHVTDSLVDVLLVQIAEPTSLPDTLLILLAGFATAVYKVMGTDFGAHLVQKTVEQFKSQYERAAEQAADQTGASKESSNLITFITELYSLKMVGANLIFDYIRLLVSKLTELNAELLLRVIRMSGPQLRQDDPLALKDIVALIRPAIAQVGESNMSVRTKFMIDTINDLKNNKIKAGASASAVVSEHVTRMKKLLGSLNTRKLESTEPLRMGLKDIEDSDKKGKWWLVGASWAGSSKEPLVRGEAPSKTRAQQAEDEEDEDILGAWGETVPDVSELEQLAREQGMNTEVRRAIFVTLLSAADYEDAFHRLQRLRLNKYDKREIPNVLIQCVGSEQHYNAYYTLIARQMCSDRKVQWAFQDSLWKLFKRLGEPFFGEEADDQEDDEAMDLRRLVNIAKMFGSLMAMGAASLAVLKPLNLPYLQPKTRSMVEIMLVTVLEEAERQKGRQEAAVSGLFKGAADPSLIRGLQYFLRKVVRKSDALKGRGQAKKLSKLCDVAEKALEDAGAAAAEEG